MVRICALLMKGSEYGQRIVENICSKGHPDWIWGLHEFEEAPPVEAVLDEPEAFTPKDLPECDLLLSLGLPQSLQAILPSLASEVNAGAVIVAVCDSSWLPPGLREQIRDELTELGIACAFPKPFCGLEEVGDPYIDEFARAFGRPELEMGISSGVIRSVEVLRGSPCGSTWYVADGLVGLAVEPREALLEAVAKAHHVYPCLGSMSMDPELGDAVLHAAQYLLREAVEKALGRAGAASSPGA
ncbi:thymidylate synthase [Candidatus Bathyarchaeota archaeon]|nr:MAG: thymidylate synthase [Candidatus Bathyarchaeota archaeon]